jgi:hypothetical protein
MSWPLVVSGSSLQQQRKNFHKFTFVFKLCERQQLSFFVMSVDSSTCKAKLVSFSISDNTTLMSCDISSTHLLLVLSETGTLPVSLSAFCLSFFSYYTEWPQKQSLISNRYRMQLYWNILTHLWLRLHQLIEFHVVSVGITYTRCTPSLLLGRRRCDNLVRTRLSAAYPAWSSLP